MTHLRRSAAVSAIPAVASIGLHGCDGKNAPEADVRIKVAPGATYESYEFDTGSGNALVHLLTVDQTVLGITAAGEATVTELSLDGSLHTRGGEFTLDGLHQYAIPEVARNGACSDSVLCCEAPGEPVAAGEVVFVARDAAATPRAWPNRTVPRPPRSSRCQRRSRPRIPTTPTGVS